MAGQDVRLHSGKPVARTGVRRSPTQASLMRTAEIFRSQRMLWQKVLEFAASIRLVWGLGHSRRNPASRIKTDDADDLTRLQKPGGIVCTLLPPQTPRCLDRGGAPR
jgi:hypothetical protein